jgi:uncharacterized LabA/DUF88 family protein
LVRFFGKTTRTAKKAADTTKTSNGASATAVTPSARASATPASRTAAKSASTTGDAPTEAAKKPTVRRRTTTARPPRRDWAAEAAATPIDTPAPKPTSLASSESEDADSPSSPVKRRRGTRGGRGRKKPGATVAIADALVPVPALIEPIRLPTRRSAPLTVESAIEQQSAVLEQFAHDVTATLQGLQAAISELRTRVDAQPKALTSNPRVGIFVDVPNLIYASERRNINIDFGRVLQYFSRDRELVRASAYAPITDDPQAKLESQRFVQHFVGHPYRIITKPLKRFADGSMKANFDIELAIDILTMSDRLDVVVLMSGDGDFRRLVELISSRGVRVEVVAFSETASSELKSVADLYVDVGQHIEDFKVLK